MIKFARNSLAFDSLDAYFLLIAYHNHPEIQQLDRFSGFHHHCPERLHSGWMVDLFDAESQQLSSVASLYPLLSKFKLRGAVCYNWLAQDFLPIKWNKHSCDQYCMSTIKHARAHHGILTLSLNNFQGPGPTSLIGWLPERVCARRRKNRKRLWKDIVFASFFKLTGKGGHRERHRRQVQTCSAGWELFSSLLIDLRDTKLSIQQGKTSNSHHKVEERGIDRSIIPPLKLMGVAYKGYQVGSLICQWRMIFDTFQWIGTQRCTWINYDDTRDHGGGFMQSAHAGFAIIPSS